MGGFLYSPKSDLSFYVSAGTAFGPPSTQMIGPRDPEESWQVEAGTKVGFLSGKGFATASVYNLQRDNIAIPDSSGFTTQQGDQRSRGFELELSAEPRKGWVAYGSYAYSDAKLDELRGDRADGPGALDFVVVDRSGNRAPLAPRHIGNLWTSRQFESGLGLAAGLRFVSSQFISEDNRFAIDSYVTVDAIVSYRIGRVRAAVNLKNLTGTEYESRGFGAVSAIPARPFEVLGRSSSASARAEIPPGAQWAEGSSYTAASRSLRTARRVPARAGGFQVLPSRAAKRASSRGASGLGSRRTISPSSVCTRSSSSTRRICP